jgi:hypothetical protein
MGVANTPQKKNLWKQKLSSTVGYKKLILKFKQAFNYFKQVFTFAPSFYGLQRKTNTNY